MSDNPKTDTSSNTQKDPDDWVSGDEPMTGAQRYLSKRTRLMFTQKT